MHGMDSHDSCKYSSNHFDKSGREGGKFNNGGRDVSLFSPPLAETALLVFVETSFQCFAYSRAL